jgi:hypothetical protein
MNFSIGIRIMQSTGHLTTLISQAIIFALYCALLKTHLPSRPRLSLRRSPMKRMLNLLFGVSLVMLAVSIRGNADISPRPSPGTAKEGKVVALTELVVVPDSKASEARLQISRDQLLSFRAALADLPVNESLAQRVARSSTRTMVAGFFLFLSVSFGGVLLVRSGSNRSRKTIAVALICAALVGAAAIISRANAGPPPGYLWRALPQNLKDGKSTFGSIEIEVMPERQSIKLILPMRSAPANSTRSDDE